MARVKAKNVGKGATIITLMSNPVIRRAVVRGATKAATSTAEFVAARREKSGSAIASEDAATSGSPTAIGAGTAANQAGKPAKPPTLAESAAVESIVGSAASVVRPMAERLANSPAGRSVLEAVNSISAQALGTAPGPRRAGASMANFVGGILANQGAGQPETTTSDRPAVKFKPVALPSGPPAEPVRTMQWPPPKPSDGSAES